MKIIRELEVDIVSVEFIPSHPGITVHLSEKDAEGNARFPVPNQYLYLDEYAQSLMINLESWIKKNLK